MKQILISVLLCFALTALSAYPAAAQQDEALVGYWSFDEGEGDTVEDMSGNGNVGTITGDVTWVEGKMGTALEFTPGANVAIPDAETLRDMDEYTIALWVNLNEFAPAWNHILEKDGSYAMTMNTGGGDFRFTPNSSAVWVESDTKVDLGTWYYLTLKSDGSDLTFYVNAEEVGTSGEPVAHNTNPINIGHEDPYTVDGVVDEVKFWAKALTPDEIKVAMEGNLAVTDPLDKIATTWASVKSR